MSAATILGGRGTAGDDLAVPYERGGRDEPNLKVIDVVICKLSKKLPAAAANTSECIETVSGRGYALRDPERR